MYCMYFGDVVGWLSGNAIADERNKQGSFPGGDPLPLTLEPGFSLAPPIGHRIHSTIQLQVILP